LRSFTKFLQIENIKYSPNNFERNWVSTLNNVALQGEVIFETKFYTYSYGIFSSRPIVIGYYYDFNW